MLACLIVLLPSNGQNIYLKVMMRWVNLLSFSTWYNIWWGYKWIIILTSPCLILVKYVLVLPLRAHQHPLVKSVILMMISLFRLFLLVSPSLCEEVIHPLMVSHMSIKIIFCWSPWLLLPHMNMCTYVYSVHSYWYILLVLLLHVVFDGQHLYISTFSLCVPFL